jgi:nucleoside-diphosphate-sugar epimerase
MKKILVTGTGGRVGGAVARDLLDHGYEVRALDVLPPRPYLREHERHASMETVYADISDRLAVLKAAEGCDAIAHLAAIPHPQNREHELMVTNVAGTSYVLEAAEAHNIKRVVLASSCCAFGLVFAKNDIDPQYFPLDESHPCITEDLYGLSKRVNELNAEAISRRAGITTVSLRLTTVVDVSSTEHMHWRKRHLARSGGWKSKECWTYVDERDTAEAFRLSLTADITGYHVLIIAARDTFSPHSPVDLARHHYTSIPMDDERVRAQNCLYDTSLAEKTIGWVAKTSWRDIEELREVEAEPLSK